ncbi:MAG TPA: Tex family protein [Bacteroidales bacterium]|nr:Tex family protein [Bacteroidales bacterium]
MDKQNYISLIASHLGHREWQVENSIRLLEDGATIPFISRYRKEMTGSLDEVQISHIRAEYGKMIELGKRREAIIKSIGEQDRMTPELMESIQAAVNLSELEDIYLPYRPKRKTRASVARENGLEPLAKEIMEQNIMEPEDRAAGYLNEKVEEIDSALQGARDIIAEWANENEKARKIVRRLFEKDAKIISRVVKGKEESGAKYSDYFEWDELLKKCPSHRLLAMRRGEDEGFLKLTVIPDEDRAIELLEDLFVRGDNRSSEQVKIAVRDSWKRLLAPSMETEFRNLSKDNADDEAIKVFAGNLRQLLLASPLGEKTVLAIDPAYRTGCKIVCLDKHGNLLHNETIFPHPPQNETAMSVRKISSLVDAYKIEAIAIGNGTASRETEEFIRWIKFDTEVQVFVVNEAGASVYSASKIARDEFPDHDVTVRGSVSIGRRLIDPLAELVKIDPKSIGVGQYQHDVDQGKLKQTLDEVVKSCVNAVGVEVNTASKHLLTYVSGLGPQLAANIVEYRSEHGPFRSRDELLNVKRMGAKAYEQCAGFLRIGNASNPLDSSAVHPESYHIVEKMASDQGVEADELISNEDIRQKIILEEYVEGSIGLPTLTDIMAELSKPGRDPRTRIREFKFADVRSLEELREGMVVPGIVTNITRFGAFVDIGVKQDGLVHISNMSKGYVKDPNEIVRINQHVKVKVISVDLNRGRIQLSMKEIE